jgi:hypothetical protein
MRVDWDHKWLAIPYKGATVVLQGLPHTVPSYTMVELWLLNSPGQSAPQAPIHPQIPLLLQQFAKISKVYLQAEIVIIPFL